MWEKIYSILHKSLLLSGYKPSEAHYMADDMCNAIARSSSSKTIDDITSDIDKMILALNQVKTELNQ